MRETRWRKVWNACALENRFVLRTRTLLLGGELGDDETTEASSPSLSEDSADTATLLYGTELDKHRVSKNGELHHIIMQIYRRSNMVMYKVNVQDKKRMSASKKTKILQPRRTKT